MTQMSKTQKALYGILAAVGITAGAAGIAAAATSQSAPDTKAPTAEQGTEHDGAEGGDEAPNYTSSVQDKASANEAAGTEESDSAEAARLEKLAKISPDEAKAAALAANPGTAKKVELESENGNVVYGVEVETSTGTVDVKVDAGTGKVLASEKDEQDKNGEKDNEKGGDKAGDHENESGPEGADD